jgi:hypothetical protein
MFPAGYFGTSFKGLDAETRRFHPLQMLYGCMFIIWSMGIMFCFR